MATIAAECSSALTGLGPFIAPESQNENGNCPALPKAATKIPAAATCTHGSCAAGRSASAMPAPPASAAPAATQRPKSAVRVVIKAVSPAETRSESRHQKPIKAYEVAPITSQANSNEGRLAADAVARAAAEKISISPWKRARDCRMFLAANTSTRKVTAATIG